MMKLSTFLWATFLGLLLSTTASAGNPNWTVNQHDYSTSMTGVIRVKMDALFFNQPGTRIAAFVGNEIRGVVNAGIFSAGNAYYPITIYSNMNFGETLIFRVYAAATDTTYLADETAVFDRSVTLGKFALPFILTTHPYCTAPVITCPAAITANTTPEICGAATTYEPSSTGNPTAEFEYTFTGATTGSGLGSGSGSTFNKGLTTVKLIAKNGCPPKDSCIFTISISDAEAPVALAPPNITIACGAAPPAGATTFAGYRSLGGSTTDNCTDTLSLTFGYTTAGFVGGNCGGSYARTYTVTDLSGNSKTVVQSIITSAAAKPTMIAPSNITVTCGTALPSPSTIVFSNQLSGGCLIVGTSNSSTFRTIVAGNCNGTVLETWKATDLCGRMIDSVSRTISIIDNVLPTALCKNISLSLNNSGNAATNALAINNGSSDNCGIVSLGISKSTFNCTNLGANVVTLSVTDNCSNVKTCAATVTIAYTQSPVAKCRSAVVVLSSAGNGSISTTGINNGSTDICSANGLTLALSKSTFNCSNLGVNIVTLTVTNVAGTASTCTAQVTVRDLTKPVAKCKNITKQIVNGTSKTVLASEINNISTDACSNPPILSLFPNTFSCPVVGSNVFPVTLTVSDASNNVSTCAATVTVLCTSSSNFRLDDPLVEANLVELLDIFPNPASDKVQVRLNRTVPYESLVSLLDYTGRVVYKGILDDGTQELTIDLAKNGIQQGIYAVTVRFADKVQTKQLVIFTDR